MPLEAPLSTSVIPPVNALIVEPTAPLGAPASSATVMDKAVSANTGASLTALTVIATESVSINDRSLARLAISAAVRARL